MGMLLFTTGFAQEYPVKVTFSVLPPYTPNILREYRQFSATLVSMESVECYVNLSLEGEGGISIQTMPGFKPAMPLVLMPNLPYELNYNNWQEAINLDHLLMAGITEADIMANGLPEGNYTLCLRVMDFMSGQPLSAEMPMGCSGFMVLSLSPPVFTDMKELLYYPTLEHTNLVSWMVDPGTPAGAYYKISGKKVPPGMNGYEAWEMPSVPFVFERTVMSGFYLLSGTDLGDITPDVSYVMAVQVTDPQGILIFQNNGWSEPYVFYIINDLYPYHKVETSQIEPPAHIMPASPVFPPDHTFNESRGYPPGHPEGVSRTWPEGHKYEKSQTWKDHKPEASKAWPANHDGGVSITWVNHDAKKSPLWPPDHHLEPTKSWTDKHLMSTSPTWPKNHYTQMSITWKDHKPAVSNGWPANHERDNSINWTPGKGHEEKMSPTWPPNHRSNLSKDWKGHTEKISAGWSAGHKFDKSNGWDKKHEINRSKAWPANHGWERSDGWPKEHDLKTSPTWSPDKKYKPKKKKQ